MLYSFVSFCIIIEIRIENHKPYVQIKVNFFFFLIYAHSQDLEPQKKKNRLHLITDREEDTISKVKQQCYSHAFNQFHTLLIFFFFLNTKYF